MGSRRVAVRRTGGFAGLRAAGEVDLAGGDPRAPEVAALLDRIDPAAVVQGASPQPDRYVYEFDLAGMVLRVAEQHLTPDLALLAGLLLTPPRTDPRGARWRE